MSEQMLKKFKKRFDLLKKSLKEQYRFGRVPAQVQELFEGLRLRWICKQMGFERLILKKNKLRCYFVENPQSPFYESELFNNILSYVATRGERKGLSFKKSSRHFILIKDGVKSLRQAHSVLEKLKEQVVRKEEKV